MVPVTPLSSLLGPWLPGWGRELTKEGTEIVKTISKMMQIPRSSNFYENKSQRGQINLSILLY
jgi:hypothetical protein